MEFTFELDRVKVKEVFVGDVMVGTSSRRISAE